MLTVLTCLQAAMWQMTFKAAPGVLPALDHNLRVDEQVSWALGCKHETGLLWGLLDHWKGKGAGGLLPAFMQICNVGSAAAGLFPGDHPKVGLWAVGCGLRFRGLLALAARRWAHFRLPALCQHGGLAPHAGWDRSGTGVQANSLVCLLLSCVVLLTGSLPRLLEGMHPALMSARPLSLRTLSIMLMPMWRGLARRGAWWLLSGCLSQV